MSYSVIGGIVRLLDVPNILGGMLLVGAILIWTKWARAGRLILTISGLALAVFAFTPAADYLARPLEEAYRRPQVTTAPKGLVVFCAATDALVSQGRGQFALTSSAECLTESILLLRRFPETRLLYLPEEGASELRAKEFVLARQFLLSFDIAENRIETLPGADPQQVAERLKAEFRPESPDEWLLIAPAMQMTRLMRVFSTDGVPVTPFPVDYRTGPNNAGWDPHESFATLAAVTREYMKLFFQGFVL